MFAGTPPPPDTIRLKVGALRGNAVASFVFLVTGVVKIGEAGHLQVESSLPSSCRPLCLLDDVRKVLDFLLAHKIEEHMAVTGIGFSER